MSVGMVFYSWIDEVLVSAAVGPRKYKRNPAARASSSAADRKNGGGARLPMRTVLTQI